MKQKTLLERKELILCLKTGFRTVWGVQNGVESFRVKYEVVMLWESFTYCAVNCYALISGYVGLQSQFKIKKFINLWIEVFFTQW